MLRSIKRVLTIYILGQNGEKRINHVNPSSDTHKHECSSKASKLHLLVMMAKFKRERERECVCVCVCVCERERESERERERERERMKERERLKPKRGQFRSLAVNRVLRLSAARLHHTIVETATEQIQSSTAVFVSYVSE